MIAPTIGAPTVGAQVVDERLTVVRELAHVGLHVGSEAVDRDEQRELPMTERVEDLAVVATGPHVIAVGHEAELGELLTDPERARVTARRMRASESPASSSERTIRNATRSRKEYGPSSPSRLRTSPARSQLSSWA